MTDGIAVYGGFWHSGGGPYYVGVRFAEPQDVRDHWLHEEREFTCGWRIKSERKMDRDLRTY